jgi:hypothetical protein
VGSFRSDAHSIVILCGEEVLLCHLQVWHSLYEQMQKVRDSFTPRDFPDSPSQIMAYEIFRHELAVNTQIPTIDGCQASRTVSMFSRTALFPSTDLSTVSSCDISLSPYSYLFFAPLALVQSG